MTPDEFAEKMRKIANDTDAEIAHLEADRLLLTVLIEHGYDEGCSIFESMTKWYA